MGSGEHSRSAPWLALAILALGGLMAACDASQPVHASTSGRPEKKLVSATTTEHSGGLTAALTTTPTRAKAGSIVQFKVTASEHDAHGALGYRLRYGDGTTAENAVPMFCLPGKGIPVRQVWDLNHRYKSPGRYKVSLTVDVNCTSDHATASITIIVT